MCHKEHLRWHLVILNCSSWGGDRLCIKDISNVIRQTWHSWFAHVERMDKEKWVRNCRSLKIDGTAGRGRPRKTWNQFAQGDLPAFHLGK